MNRIMETVLAPAEWIYRAGLGAVKWAYRRGILKTHRLPVQVVSVGNLTWGGTGKTPLVIHLAGAFRKAGRRVAVLTRGYGGDEDRLLADRLESIPVIVGPDRVQSGLRAVRDFGADLLLLDDGYQQWRLAKDLEILTVDGASGFGNGRLIPRGVLREPEEEAARADLIVVKEPPGEPSGREAIERRLRRLNPHAPLFWMRYACVRLRRWPGRETLPVERLRGAHVCTLAGIGDPASFEGTVSSLGAVLALRRRVRDHHRYGSKEIAGLLRRCRGAGVRIVVTTAKDALRLPRSAGGTDGTEFLVLEIEPTFEPNESELLHRITALLSR